MFFREILNEDLGCASYIVADGGEAVVVDPRWAIEEYLEIAEEDDFEITRILETHNHADHVSGRGQLVEATGAKIHISREAGGAAMGMRGVLVSILWKVGVGIPPFASRVVWRRAGPDRKGRTG